MNASFVLGVNYWPRKKAMYWWSDFDAGEVDEEFAIIHELGLTLVRIFLLWDDFQPAPGVISTHSLNNLVTVANCADRYDLKLDVTFFTGHMSGPNWAPRWMLHGRKPFHVMQVVSKGEVVNRGYLNPFSNVRVIAAEKLQLQAVVGELKYHPAIWCWNLGNEPDLFAHPRSDEVGALWVRDMVATIKAIDPVHPVTCGLHIASLLKNIGLRVDQVFSSTDFAVMHAYPMYSRPLSKSPLDPHFVPFTCALTTALSGKPVLMEEFGGCTASKGHRSYVWTWRGYERIHRQFMASEEALAEYYAQVLPKLVEVGAMGALSWCFADYHPSLWDKPPCSGSKHERFFGLLRPDGSLKPHAEVIKQFAATKPMVVPAKKKLVLPYTSTEYYKNTSLKIFRLYNRWLEQG